MNLEFDAKECGMRIKELRKKKNMSQVQMSMELHISVDHVSFIERGVKTASIPLLVDIANYFDVSMDYLILGKSMCASVQVKKEYEAMKEHFDRLGRLL